MRRDGLLTEVQITPDKIQAGVRALWSFNFSEIFEGAINPEDVVHSVLNASLSNPSEIPDAKHNR